MSDVTSRPPPAAKSTSQQPSLLWDAFRGSFVAVAEVAVCGQYFVYFKNKFQQGERPSLNPREWYKGFPVHAASMVPVCALQMVSNNMLSRIVAGDSNKELTPLQKGLCSLGAGATTSAVAGPTEMMVLYQQQQGKKISLGEATRQITQRFGAIGLTRGMAAVAARDGIFVFGYLTAGPAAQKHVTESTGSVGLGVAASAGCGTIAGLVTHPFDTVKTRVMQPVTQGRSNLMTAAAELYREGGVATFFKGAIPRTLRIAASVVLYSNMNAWLDTYRPA